MGERFLNPMAEARIRSMIGAISGLMLTGVREMGNGRKQRTVTFHLEGWSPSLNAMAMSWNAVANRNHDEEGQIAVLLQWLAPHMEIQRRRLAAGLEFGTAAPFGVATMDGSGGRSDTKWGHILIDRGLAALMEDARKGGMDCEISDTVFDLHQPDQGARDGLEERLEGDATDDDGEPMGRHALHGRALTHDVRVGSALYDGARLLVRDRIPETLLLAATGRTLGELAEVPAAIARHVITGGASDEGGTRIDVEPRLATASRLLAEIAAGGVRADG